MNKHIYLRTRYLHNTLIVLVIFGIFKTPVFATGKKPIFPALACEVDLEVPDDITICSHEDFTLEGEIYGNILSFLWTENGEFLSDSDLNPTVFLEETTTFTLTAYSVNEDNLIINGDFESGDYIEYTDYYLGLGSCFSGLGYLACEGTYGIETNPNDGHTNFSNCTDMSGGGSMMVVNGAASFQQIWCQTIDVEPDGIYQFTAWAASVNPASPAELQFAIDGTLIGDLFSLSSTVCNWEEFFAVWESNGSTSVEICITNQNTAAGGNDFALDNIAFHEVCMSQDSFTVTVSNYDVLWNTPETLTCVDNITDILLEIDPIGDYNIQWESSTGGIIEEASDGTYIFVDAAGDYFVTVTDDNNCSKEFEIEVEAEQEQPEIYIDINNQIDCENLQAYIEADGDQSNLDYLWFNEYGELISNTEELLTSESGEYQIIITNMSTGCSNDEFVEVTVDTMPPSIDLFLSNNIDCHNDFATLSTNYDEGILNWAGPGGISLPSNTSSLMVQDTGIYVLIAESDNHCIAIDSITLSMIPSEIDYDFLYDTLISCNHPSSNISLFVDTSLFDIIWDNPSIPDSLNFDLTVAGNYIFSISDSLDCVVQDSIIINADFEIPETQIHLDTIDCEEPVARLFIDNNNNAFEMEWHSPAGSIYQGDTLQTSLAGQYQYILTGTNGCVTIDSISVETSEDFPQLGILGDTLNCLYTEIELIASSNQELVSTRWISPTMEELFGDSITVSTPGVYLLEGINDLGCISEAIYTLVSDTIPPQINIELPDTLSCSKSKVIPSVTVDATATEFYWTGQGINASTKDVELHIPGLYHLEVSASNGCRSVQELEVFIDTIVPLISLLSDTILDCNTTSIIPQVLESYDSLSWMGPNVAIANDLITIQEPGFYVLEVYGKNGCHQDTTIEITGNYALPEFDIESTPITCRNEEATIHINTLDQGNELYFISGMDTLANASEFISNYDQDLYVAVRGTNGCLDVRPVSFEFDTAKLDFTLEAGILDCGEDPVFIDILNTGIIEVETVYFEGGIFGNSNTPIFKAGEYIVEIEGTNGCKSQKSVEVRADTSTINFQLFAESLNCREDPVFIEIGSISAPYSNLTILDASGNHLGDLSSSVSQPGTYTVMLEGANHCVSSREINIEKIQDRPRISYLDLDFLHCEEAAIIRDLDIIGGSSPYKVRINGDNYSTAIDTYTQGPGKQIIEIEDANGCVADTSYIINHYDHIVLNIPDVLTVREGTELQLELDISKDLSEIYSIDWMPHHGLSCYDCISPILLASEDVSYRIQVIDLLGCVSETEIRIIVEEEINIFIPNVININSNSGNNFFTIFSEDGDISVIEELLIFDRWGNRVFSNFDFQANQNTEGWDGHINNDAALQGVYVYTARILLHNGETLRLSGDLTLIR